MTRQLEFFFDFASPFTYLAYTQLPKLMEKYGYSIIYKPIDLQKAKLAVGNIAPPTREMPVKAKYIWQDLYRWGKRYGVPIDRITGLDALPLNLLAFLAIDRGCEHKYLDVVWSLTWAQGGELDMDHIMQSVADQMGWDLDEMQKLVNDEQSAARLSAETDEAHDKGIFGVPGMLIEDQLWWGNDRLMFLEEFLEERKDSK